MKIKWLCITLIVLICLFTVIGCAAGNSKFDVQPANFLMGLWHGLICGIAFIISLFSDSVRIYEVNNIGGWYDFGFIIGAAISLGSGWGTRKYKKKKKSEEEWEEIGEKVESKIKQEILKWTDEEKKSGSEWEEIGKKVEEKIKRELRKWAEK